MCTNKYPTDTFTVLAPRNPLNDKLNVARKRRSPDFEALKLWKGRSGSRRACLVVRTFFFSPSELTEKWIF